MAHPFSIDRSIEVQASPEDIWEAVATGPGLDGWFIGTPNAVEPGLGGTVRVAFGEDSGESTITAWDRPRRFAHASAVAPDGVVHAFEYTIEGRTGGTTTVRMVHSGFLGDDWEAEYEALTEGDYMYLRQMGDYVEHFRGRRSSVIAATQPNALDRNVTMAAYRAALGLTAPVTEGMPARFAMEGTAPISGVVDFVSPSIIGVRTEDGLYRFSYVSMGVVYLGHHIYRDDLDTTAATAAWGAWLAQVFPA